MSGAARWRWVAAIVLGLLLPAATAQDYAREKRWEAEVTGNLVVGDAVKLRLRSGHEFLALYAPVKDAKTGIVLVHGTGVYLITVENAGRRITRKVTYLK